MNLGFYYHIPAITDKEGRIGLPAFFGRFVDSIANEVEHLFCFFHSSPLGNESADKVEYWCESKNITLVSLGMNAPAYIKFYFPSIFFINKKKFIYKCDTILVRSPSPIAPYFERFGRKIMILYFLVGSYKEGSKYLDHLPIYKRWAVKCLSITMHNKMMKVCKNKSILVNSLSLEEELKGIASKISVVNTTTLHQNDFFERLDTCSGEEIFLLYTGRIDLAKGLNELMDAFIEMRKKGYNIFLTLVGWEDDPLKPVERMLKEKALKNQVDEWVSFPGKVSVGEMLFNYYRNSDIYLIPTYHEGFPRTIWEAMANSIPVICTPVGSIPYFLKDNEEVLMIPPKNVSAIVEAISKIISQPDLRQKLIKNAFQRVQEMKLDVQAKKIIQHIENDWNYEYLRH